MTTARNHRIHAPLAASAALALLLPLAAAAQGHHGPHHRFFGGGPPGLGPGPRAAFALGIAFERLDLTADQREAIGALLVEHHERMAEMHERLAAARRELFDAAAWEGADEAEIRAAASELGDLEAELALGRAGLMTSVREVLTPEQLEEARRMRQRFGEHRRHHGCPGCRGRW